MNMTRGGVSGCIFLGRQVPKNGAGEGAVLETFVIFPNLKIRNTIDVDLETFWTHSRICRIPLLYSPKMVNTFFKGDSLSH